MSNPTKPGKGNTAVNTTVTKEPHYTTKRPTKLTIGNEVWLDNSDLQRSLNVTNRTLLNWRKKGVLQHQKLGGKIFYCERELLRLLAQQTISISK